MVPARFSLLVVLCLFIPFLAVVPLGAKEIDASVTSQATGDSVLRGVVSSSADGSPLAGTTIQVMKYTNRFVLYRSSETDATGAYVIADIEPGIYWLRTRNRSQHFDEIWQNIKCTACFLDDYPEATQIQIEAPTELTFDFQLDPGPAVSGLVTDAVGQPLSGASVRLYLFESVIATTATTREDGTYITDNALLGGTYYATAELPTHARELFREIDCGISCTKTAGEPIVVAAEQIDGIDFTLIPKGAIEGVLTDELTGEPLPGRNVRAYTAQGQFAVTPTDVNGHYSLLLPPGTFWVLAESGPYALYWEEVWNDVRCVWCDVTTGSPLQVISGGTLTADFALEPKYGRFTGRVTDAATGAAMPGVEVWARGPGGGGGNAWTNSDGVFRFDPWFEPATYQLYAMHEGYVTELYGGLHCDRCDVSAPQGGTPVVISGNEIETGIDFALDRSARITGSVLVPDGGPLDGIEVRLRDLNGAIIERRSAFTSADGSYTLPTVGPGTYFVEAWSGMHDRVLYPSTVCYGACDFASATQITVGLDETRELDFSLRRFTATSVSPSSGAGNDPPSVTISGIALRSDDLAELHFGQERFELGVSARTTDSVTAFVPPVLPPGSLLDVRLRRAGAFYVVSDSKAQFMVDFTDAPASDPFHDFVETIFRAGITAGCGNGNFCTSSPVTRGQMAVFLLAAKHGRGYAPPPVTNSRFSDVSGAFMPWIEQLADEGITGGCSPTQFCPGSAVTRAQMAVFLLAAKEGMGWTPPPATGLFEDVTTSSGFAPWIEELARRGITAGCGDGKFCPDSAVTRGQMAVFLTTNFNLE